MSTLDLLCQQVSALLAHYPQTMLQFSPHQIEDFMKADRGVIVTHPDHDQQLMAFAKLHEWPGLTQEGRRLFELGSWVVEPQHRHQGYGAQVLLETVKKGKMLDPEAQIISVIEQGNLRAQQLTTDLGGMVLAKKVWPSNLQIILQEGAAQVVVYDITQLAES